MQTVTLSKNPSFLILGILLVSFNLRPSITSVGPLIPMIRTDLALSNAWAGFLTTLPLLTFATFSLFSARFGNRLGHAKAIFFGLIILLAGTVIRVSGGTWLLYLGTALTGIGIVVCNVLLIPLVKNRMPSRTGQITGMYTTGMTLMAAIASAVSVPLAQGLAWGWRGALLFWSITLVITLVLWYPHIRPTPASTGNIGPILKVNVWKSRLAWQVSAFMGVQSLMFFTLITWLPDMLIARGMSAAQAGYSASFMQITALVGTFLAPIIATRYRQQSGLNLFLGLVYLLGFSLLFPIGNSANLVGIAITGLCMGASISMAYTLIALRTASDQTTAALSGMAQSSGYYLAAFGPLLFGMAFDIWQNWNILIYLMLCSTFLFSFFGYFSGKAKSI
ncbi:CynX/NimT family MFS transporter [Pleomorphovibrio marinus]|uniref:CynX/NimT family MFS transporter n=1 Tax=Pleomorphovibrio marinus TaxID=2164132 RepID=UPI000E0B293D|nr:MFS transporter [Pleomorphovibrio marinus]